MRTGSHVNALFKGRHQGEFAWFSIGNAFPLFSTTAEHAAKRVVDACRHGDSYLAVTIPARLLIIADALAPNLLGQAMKLMNWLLPGPTRAAGDEVRTGWESQSSISPSLLTRLADQAIADHNEAGGHTMPVQTQRRFSMATDGDRVTKSIIVKGGVSDIFDLWSNFENFPHFMKYIKTVHRIGDRVSHWVMEGPLGKEIEWVAEITTFEPNKRIAWSTKDRASEGEGDITTSGQVTFRELTNNETEVTVMLHYVPPAGKVGEVVAKIFSNPDSRLQEDLRNFKAYAEGMFERTSAH
jgi:uncharacterized membrane protein